MRERVDCRPTSSAVRRPAEGSSSAFLRHLTTVAAAVLLTSVPQAASGFPWSIDMFRGEAVQPMDQAPRSMPPGTLPVDGERQRSTAASRKLPNPLAAAAKDIEQGHQLYSVYCSACHGPAGRGNGPVKFMLRTPPADLTSKRIALMKDGSIYGTIRNGTQIMPPYGDALSPIERWRIVLYIRDLQQKSVAGNTAAAGSDVAARPQPAAPPKQ
jgi:S-disulfanyl-L-cysteine oxidoreductase SoxD